jgi:hypothetical protein
VYARSKADGRCCELENVVWQRARKNSDPNAIGRDKSAHKGKHVLDNLQTVVVCHKVMSFVQNNSRHMVCDGGQQPIRSDLSATLEAEDNHRKNFTLLGAIGQLAACVTAVCQDSIDSLLVRFSHRLLGQVPDKNSGW